MPEPDPPPTWNGWARTGGARAQWRCLGPRRCHRHRGDGAAAAGDDARAVSRPVLVARRPNPATLEISPVSNLRCLLARLHDVSKSAVVAAHHATELERIAPGRRPSTTRDEARLLLTVDVLANQLSEVADELQRLALGLPDDPVPAA